MQFPLPDMPDTPERGSEVGLRSQAVPRPVGAKLYHAVVPMLTGERTDPLAKVAVLSLVPTAILYTVGLKLYLLPYRLGLRRRHRLPCCVVSIGNLVAGGTGKTGLTITLARGLQQAGYRLCILSRGFHGHYSGAAAVISTPSEILHGPDVAGDEPALMARALPGVPVIVGKDRRLTGRLAVERFRPQIIILDDGAQYYQLHRDVEIILLTATRPFGNGWTLPAGVLREPPSHLKRATHVVIHFDRAGCSGKLPELRTLPENRLFSGRYIASALEDAATRERFPAEQLRGTAVASLCALGNPQAFEETLTATGAHIVRAYRLPDHATLRRSEAQAILQEAKQAGAASMVISQKDAVKWPSVASPLPVFVLVAEFHLDRLDELVFQIAKAADQYVKGGSQA